MKKESSIPIFDENSEVECLADNNICAEPTIEPEIGFGVLPPLNKFEGFFNWLSSKMPYIAAVCLFCIAVLISVDIIARTFFGISIEGTTDLEGLAMTVIGFVSLAYAVTTRQSISIDMLYNVLERQKQRIFNLFSNLLCTIVCLIIGYAALDTAMDWTQDSPLLEIPQSPFVYITALSLLAASLGYFFQVIHSVNSMLAKKEYLPVLIAFALSAFIIAIPFIYKATGYKLSGLAIGGIGFAILLCIMMLRVPLGFAMSIIGVLGIIALSRRPEAAVLSLGSVPFLRASEFTMIAFPMFMLMGEMTFQSGLSTDLFNVANKWLGKMPGGLACASVGGCAGFGAVCGDSLATVITMTSVAMPPMIENNYDTSLAAGAIAAGGTLGILIPPSMGFIFYSIITEESIGKLFVAGILPGILLTAIFIAIIVIQVKLDPSKAPKGKDFTMSEKLKSLWLLLPVAVLFIIVVGGILYGFFTPAEGGAAGAVIAYLFAVSRRTMSFRSLCETLLKAAAMFGKFFSLFVGLYIFGAFLTESRLPNMLSDFITGLEVNRYLVLSAIILVYIVLGCVMNIMPMMMLTLPSIYPTVQALGFDGIWFGVITVIVMEMGMITPPVGMNVFTLASLRPEITSGTIFKGVMPFFIGMLICVAILILFPGIALVLVN